jgi:TP901 family phage tail tape measure protein
VLTAATIKAIVAVDLVPFDKDMDQVEARAQRTAQTLEKTFNGLKVPAINLPPIKVPTITLPPITGVSAAGASLDRLQEKLAALSSHPAAFTVAPQLGAATHALDDLYQRLHLLSGQPATIQVRAEMRDVREQIAAITRDTTQLGRALPPIRPVVDTAPAVAATNTLKSVLTGLGSVGGTIGSGIARATQGIGAALGGAASAAASAGSRIGSALTGAVGHVVSGFAQIGSAATGAVGHITSFVQRSVSGLAQLGLAAQGVRVLVTAVLALGSAFGVGKAMDFEAEMSKISATAGASAQELAVLRQTALDLGQANDVGAVSAAGAADAIFEMTKAGLNTQQIASGAAKAVLQLAAAAGPEYGVANAAALASNVLNTFASQNLNATQAVNTLVGAANASSIGLSDLQYGLAAVGTVANGIGMSFHDLAQNLAVFGTAGLKGQDAGTSLKSMLISLQPHTKAAIAAFKEFGLINAQNQNILFNSNGSVKAAGELAGILQQKLGALNPAQRQAALYTMFGTDAMRAANIAVDKGAAGYQDMADQMTKQGHAAVAAATMNDNAKGKWETLRGTIETLQIQFASKLLPAMGRVFDAINAPLSTHGAQEFFTHLGEQAGIAASKVADAVDHLVAGAGKIGPALSVVGQYAAIGFHQLQSVATQASAAVGGIFTQLTSHAATFGPLLAQGLNLAAGSFGKLIQAGQQLAPLLLPALQQLVPVLAVLLPNALSLFGSVWLSVVIPAVGQAGSVILTTLVPALVLLLQHMGPLFTSAASAMGGLVSGVIAPAFSGVASIVGNVLIPALLPLIDLLTAALPGAVSAAGSLMNGVLIPAFAQVANSVAAFILPAITALAGILIQNLPSAVSLVGSIFNGILVPVFNAVAQVIGTVILPALGQLITFLMTNLPPAIAAVSGFVQTALIPAFTTVASFVGTTLLPALERIGQILLTQVIPPILAVAGPILSVVIPALTGLANIIVSVVLHAFEDLSAKLTLAKAQWDSNFGGMRTVIETVGAAIGVVITGIIGGLALLNGNTNEAKTQMANAYDIMGNHAEAAALRTQIAVVTGLAPLPAYAAGVMQETANACQILGSEANVNLAYQNSLSIAEAIKQGIAPPDAVGRDKMGHFVDVCGNILAGAAAPMYAAAQRAGMAGAQGLASTLPSWQSVVAQFAAQLRATQLLAKGISAGTQEYGAQYGGKAFQTDMNNILAGTSTHKLPGALANPYSGGNNTGNNTGSNTGNNTGNNTGSNTGNNTGSNTGSKKDKAKSAIEEATSQVKNISDAIKSGIDALSKLSQFTLPAGLNTGLEAFAQAEAAVMARIQQIALHYSTKGLEATGALAEASQKVFSSLSAGVDLFSKITEATSKGVTFSGQNLAAATLLLTTVVGVTTAFGKLVPPWKDEQIAHVSAFADASGKVLGTLNTGVDFYGKIAEATSKGVSFGGQNQILAEGLARSVVATTVAFGAAVPPWKDQQVTQVSAFADASGKVLGSLSSGVDLYSKIAEATAKGVTFGAQAQAATDALARAVVGTTVTFGTLVPPWRETQVAQVSAFADASGKVLGSLSAGVDFYSKIAEATAKGVTFGAQAQAATADLARSVVAVTTQYASFVPTWSEQQTSQVSAFADASGKVLSSLSSAVDLFSKIRDATAQGVTFGQEMVGQAGALATATRSISDQFKVTVPVWSDLEQTQITQYADTSGKILGTIGAAVDTLTKLRDSQLGLAQVQSLLPTAAGLSEAVKLISESFKTTVPAWSELEQSQITTYSDTASKILGTIGVAVDTLSKLRDSGLGLAQVQSLIPAAQGVGEATTLISTSFQAGMPAWDSFANTQVSQYAESTGKIVGAVSVAVDLLMKLQDSGLGFVQIQSLIPQAQAVGEGLTAIAVTFQAAMPPWDTLAMQTVGAFADTTGKIVTGLSAGLDLLTKLQDLQDTSVPDAALQAVITALTLSVLRFQAAIVGWDAKGVAAAAQLAESAGKIVGGISGALDLLTKLQALQDTSVPDAALQAVITALTLSVLRFQAATIAWDAKGVAASAQLAESSGKIVSGVSGALDLLGKLQGLKDTAVPAGALDSVIAVLTASVERFQAATVAWEAKGLAAAAANAESVGKVASALGAGVDVLTKLSTYQAPSTGQIDSYFAGLTVFVQAWQTRSKGFEAEGLAAAAATADSAGKIATGIGAAIDPLVKLGTFQAPSQAGIDSFFAAMGALILGFQAREAAWAAQMTPATVQLASDVAAVTSAISAAIEPLSKMAALAEKPLDPGQIDATFALIGLTLQALQNLTGAINPDQLAAAVVFGGQLSAALGSVKAAVDLLASLSGAQVDPAAVAGVIGAVGAALAAVPVNLAQGVADNIGAAVAILHTAGDQLMQGLAGGIDAGTHWVVEAATRAVQAAIDAGKATAGIASPSKRTFAEWGLPLMQGGAGGVTAGVPLFTKAVRKGFTAVFAQPLPGPTFGKPVMAGPPLPAAGPGAGSYGKGSQGGGGSTTIITGSTIVNGTVHASTPTATRDLMVGVARRTAIRNPGKVGN